MADVNSFDDLKAIKGLKLVHLNTRSIVKKIDQLRLLLSDSKIDVLTISESWMRGHLHSDLVGIEGFTTYRLDRESEGNINKRGGGLLTYVCSKLASSYETLFDLNASNGNIEAQWTLVHRENCKNVIICNLYRLPKGDLKKALKYLDDCLKSVNMGKSDVFILGDINVNYKNKSSLVYKKVSFFAQSNGLSQHIKNVTRCTDKSNSLLDVAFSNSKFISLSGTLDHFISDHQPIFVVHKKLRDKRSKEEFMGRSYRNFDKDKFKGELLDSDWEDLFAIESPEAAWNFIMDNFTQTLDTMCPIRAFRIKNYRPDWMSNELIEQIKDRDYFYKKAKLRGNQDDWNIAKHLRNLTNSNIRHAKRDFVLDKLKLHELDAKKFWKTIHSVAPLAKAHLVRMYFLNTMALRLEKKKLHISLMTFSSMLGKWRISAWHQMLSQGWLTRGLQKVKIY